MTAGSQADFDLNALHAALDAQRQARGLTWLQTARAISRQFEATPARPLASATLTGLRDKASVEGDGVLQMLLWLNRSAESFIPGGASSIVNAAPPSTNPSRILRFDSAALYSALEARRLERGMTWRQVAGELGLAPASLTRLTGGGRVVFPQVMRIFRWLGRPAASFTRLAAR